MSRPALWALLLILPLTMGLRSVQQGERQIDTERLIADATGSLTRQGWSVRTLKHDLIGRLIEGRRGDCEILVHFVPPEGVSDDKFRGIAQPVGDVTYQYRGQPSRDFPRLGPLLHWHFQRYVASFAMATSADPIVATARSPDCGPLVPDFTGLRQHLQAA